jgi:hypothetical protein
MSLLKLLGDSEEGRWLLQVVFTLSDRGAHAMRLKVTTLEKKS